jgi:hypothetical protein
MALITDPDLLNQGSEVTINTGAKTIALAIAGNLSTDGVTLKALYSFLKEEWRNDAALIKFDFPMTPITDEQMQIGVSSRNNGWNFADSTTRELIRTGGWQEVNGSGTVTAEYAGIVTLGSLEAGTQVYYQKASGGSTTNFVLTDEVNQAVQVYNSTGPVDTRSYMKLFAREQGDKYATSTLADIGVTTMTYQVYRFPLATTSDIKITVADVGIDANSDNTPDVAPYDGMTITFHNVAQARTIGGVSRNFGIIIDGNGGTLEQIYEFVQWSLRRTSDIDNDGSTLVGKIAPELLEFVGDTLKTKYANANPEAGGNGVYIDDIQTADVNRIVFLDNTNTERTNPYTANITVNFSSTLQTDSNAIYRIFFTNDDAGANAGNDFATSTAIIPRSSEYYATTNRARTSNVATITTSVAHGLAVGDIVETVSIGGTGYNSVNVVLSVPSGTTFTYASTGSDEGSTADTGGIVHVCMGGKVNGAASIAFGYDYDSNVQRGSGSDGEDAPFTGVAIGLSSAQYVLATTLLTRSTANSLTLTAPTERNYANP